MLEFKKINIRDYIDGGIFTYIKSLQDKGWRLPDETNINDLFGFNTITLSREKKQFFITIVYWHGTKYDDCIYFNQQKFIYTKSGLNDIINEIIDLGYNVMIQHKGVDSDLIVWIDKGKFRQS